MSDPVLHALLTRVGHYAGHGINREDEPFHAELHMASLDVQPGVTLKFRAVGIDGTVYEDERTWIAIDPDGKVAMWSIHANGGGVRKHVRRDAMPAAGCVLTLVFGFGDLSDRTCFRQELGIDLWPDGDITYRYSWGLPGSDHQPRSTVRLKATS